MENGKELSRGKKHEDTPLSGFNGARGFKGRENENVVKGREKTGGDGGTDTFQIFV